MAIHEFAARAREPLSPRDELALRGPLHVRHDLHEHGCYCGVLRVGQSRVIGGIEGKCSTAPWRVLTRSVRLCSPDRGTSRTGHRCEGTCHRTHVSHYRPYTVGTGQPALSGARKSVIARGPYMLAAEESQRKRSMWCTTVPSSGASACKENKRSERTSACTHRMHADERHEP